MQSANYSSPLTVQGNSSGEALPVTTPTGASSSTVQGVAADGAAVAGNPVLVGGVDTAGNAQSILTSTAGIQIVGSSTSSSDSVSNTLNFTLDQAGAQRALAVAMHGYNATDGDWERVRVISGQLSVREIGGLSASAVFTPAAASHVAGDVNGGAQTFDLNAPASSVFEIQSASLLIAGGTIETTAWELHLFSVTPPSALADDGAFVLASGDHASYLGFVALAQVVDYGDALYIESNNVGKRVQLAASGDLFAYLVNRTTLTPQAVAHTVKIVGKPV